MRYHVVCQRFAVGLAAPLALQLVVVACGGHSAGPAPAAPDGVSSHESGNAPLTQQPTTQQPTTQQPTTQQVQLSPAQPLEPCVPFQWTPAPKAKWLRKVGSAKAAAGEETFATQGRGGATSVEAVVRGCSDDPNGLFVNEGTVFEDTHSGLEAKVTNVRDVGNSKRNWPGVQCEVELRDPGDARLHAVVTLSALNDISAIWRDGSAAFVAVNFNGYAKEVAEGNQMIALDLCTHEEVWRSKSFTSNAPSLVEDNVIYTAYGFTKEPDFVYVLDRGTGKTLERHRVPTGPSSLVRRENVLEFSLYEGVARFELQGP